MIQNILNKTTETPISRRPGTESTVIARKIRPIPSKAIDPNKWKRLSPFAFWIRR
jgi:hypothetical protein